MHCNPNRKSSQIFVLTALRMVCPGTNGRTFLMRTPNFVFFHARQLKMLRPPVSLSAKPPGVAAAAGQDVQGLQELPRRARRSSREHWRRLSLDRKLLMAVTPWVGNVLLPRTLQAGRMAFHQTKGTGDPSCLCPYFFMPSE